jgi:4-oxalomesaconate hydratase
MNHIVRKDDQPRLLVISAHAADFCSRAGGAIIKYTRRTCPVRVVDLSLGERGESNELWAEQPGITFAQVREIRRQEAERAAAQMGAEIRFYDWLDHPMTLSEERLVTLVDEIREMRADLLLTHHISDPLNLDHEYVAKAVLEACSLAQFPGLQTRFAPTPSPALYFFEATIPMTELTGFKPNLYIDITDVFEGKMQALRLFQSQSFLPQAYERYATWRGSQAKTMSGDPNIIYAEAFQQYLPSVGNEFPLTGRYHVLARHSKR